MAPVTLKIPGTLSPESVARLEAEARGLLKKGRDVRLDGSELGSLDSLGQAFLATLNSEAERLGKKLVVQGLQPRVRESLAEIPAAPQNGETPEARPSLFESTGAGAYALLREWRDIALLLSEALYYSTFGRGQRKTLLPGDTVTQMIRLGSTALPIVLLLSGLIGFTLALQSGLQLSKYGAAIFLADGIGISMITEIGPLMTAVILAGRSGSAITAELATMTVQEEVSALQSMAVNPLQFLVLPRFWALTITQPLLTVASALAGIFAGMGVALLFFEISPSAFMNEIQQAVRIHYIWQMLVKSVTFSWLIVLIASVKGLGVRGGADAVGRATTACVVTCIFAIVLTDALFSFLFYL
jgi:phospholipid/cholesterol/gamma-HCH transport system permease protein